MDDKSPTTITLDTLVDQLSRQQSTPRPSTPAPAAPVNLPVAPTPRPVTPPAPPAISKVTPVPIPTPAPTAHPVPPQPAPQLKSMFRTMGDDLNSLKNGVPLTKTEVKSTIQPIPRVPAATPPTVPPRPVMPIGPAPSVAPKIAPPVPTPSSVRPAASSTIPVRPLPATPPGPQITVPNHTQRSINPLYPIVVVVLLLAGGGYWFLNHKSSSNVAVSPTPSTSTNPTNTPVPTLDSIFTGLGEPITLASTGEPTADFLSQINSLSLTGGQLKKLAVTSAEKGSTEINFLDLLDRALITYPVGLRDSIGEDAAILAYGQQESFNTQGQLVTNSTTQKRLVFLMEIKDPIAYSDAVTTWESSMPTVLATLLSINKAKAANSAFLNGTYQQALVHYRNFPYADQSMDYTLITASNGRTYFVLSNSRESIFATIDRLGQPITPTPSPSTTP